jgi:Type IV secretion system pilin
MRKTLLFIALTIAISVPLFVSAQGFIPLAPIPGLTDETTANKVIGSTANGIISSGSFADFFNNLYKFLLGLAIALAIIEIIWGGLEISTESVSKKTSGKQRIYNAIFGLIFILSPVLVFSLINPCILNLSINLTPLGAKPTTDASCK